MNRKSSYGYATHFFFLFSNIENLNYKKSNEKLCILANKFGKKHNRFIEFQIVVNDPVTLFKRFRKNYGQK
jgi:hypothetical protein